MREKEAAAVLEAVTFLPITEEIRDVAGIVGTRELKSLDAIHLATAFSLAMDDRLGVLFAYDNGVINSARLEDMPVVTPVPE
jgi:predicted nucleic acid-binding protein